MAGHHLLSPLARNLSDDDFCRFINSDNEPLAYLYFMYHRWGSLTKQICPRCGVIAEHYPRPRHRQWRCRDCAHDFSLKSGGIFDGSKLPYWKIVKAIYLFATNAKGISAIYLASKLQVTYDTAYMLMQKIRWSFWKDQPVDPMTGEFDVDVVWVLKGIKLPNDRTAEGIVERQAKRRKKFVGALIKGGMAEAEAMAMAAKDKRFMSQSEPRRDNPKKQCILCISKRKPKSEGGGSEYSVGIPLLSENYDDIRTWLHRYAAKGSTIYTDHSGASVALSSEYEVKRVNHSEHYVTPDGVHTNFVEAIFSRWRRMEIGTYHKMIKRTLALYFGECSWRDMMHRKSPTEKLTRAMSFLVKLGPCPIFNKYGDMHAHTQRAFNQRKSRKRAKTVLQAMPKAEPLKATKFGELLRIGEKFGSAISGFFS